MLAGKPPHSKRVSSAGGPARGSDTARLDRGLASLCALQFHQMPWSMEALLPADLPPTSVATRGRLQGAETHSVPVPPPPEPLTHLQNL